MESQKFYTPAQVQLFKLAYRTSEMVNKALHNQLEQMTAWLKAQYGDTAPTYEQFWSDRDALKLLAAEKGLVDDQWVRKPYNAAVKALYGDIPLSPSKDAVDKRAQRPVLSLAITGVTGKGAAGTVGTRSGKSLKVYKVEMPKDAVAAVRQMLERYGFAQVLLAFSQVLAEHRETAKEAKRMATIGQQYGAAHPDESHSNGKHAVH